MTVMLMIVALCLRAGTTVWWLCFSRCAAVKESGLSIAASRPPSSALFHTQAPASLPTRRSRKSTPVRLYRMFYI